MPVPLKDDKLIVFGPIFVICCSCVLRVSSHFNLGVTFDVLNPKGFRISIPDTQNPRIQQIIFEGKAWNKTIFGNYPVLFPTNFRRIGDQWVYENNEVTIEPGQKYRYHIVAYDENELYPKKTSTPTPECDWSKTTVQGRHVCQGELIFHENFDFLNYSIWNREIRIPLDIDDGDFVIYRDDEETLGIIDGKLNISPLRLVDLPGFDEAKVRRGELNLGNKCTGIVDREKECKRQAERYRILPPIVSARINTKKSFSFRYGKVEVRAKLPKGDWLFPLIVLDPLTSDYGISGYASGQMRVAFIRGNENLKTKQGWAIDGSYLSGGVVLATGEEERHKWLGTVRGREHWGNTFHTYTLTWTDSEISLAYDGNTYTNLNGFNYTLDSSMVPFDKEFYISFGVSAGGISDFPEGSVWNNVKKPWENLDPKAELHFWNARNEWFSKWDVLATRLIVDYVKVWAL